MDKHPTAPPHDPAFLAKRDPHKIRDWLIEYFTAVVDATMADGTGGAGEGSALLRAFDTVWTFEEVPRGIMCMLAARDLAQSECVAFWPECGYQRPECGCVYCRYADVLGYPPMRLHAPLTSGPHGVADSESGADHAVYALSQVKPLRQPLPGGYPVAAGSFRQVSQVAQTLPSSAVPLPRSASRHVTDEPFPQVAWMVARHVTALRGNGIPGTETGFAAQTRSRFTPWVADRGISRRPTDSAFPQAGPRPRPRLMAAAVAAIATVQVSQSRERDSPQLGPRLVAALTLRSLDRRPSLGSRNP